MDRRDFLKGVLALGALSGCQGSQAPRREAIQGRIVGASFREGHRLRVGGFPAPSRRMKVGVAVLGGGIAGLSAGWKLAKSGFDDFHLFELEAEVGGNARAHRYPESSAPWAAHYLPVPTRESRAVRELLTDMGLLQGYGSQGEPLYDERHLCHAPQERVYYGGRWEDGLYPKSGASPEDLRQLEQFQAHLEGWKGWRDGQGRKAFAIPLELSSRDPQVLELDTLTMAQYMDQHGWTSPRLRWFAEYGCRDDYGTSLAQTSAWAGLHYFASRDGGGFDPPDSEFVWPEGNAHLTDYLRGCLGSRITSRCLVYKVERGGRGIRVLALDLDRQETVEIEAHRAIYAMPTFTRPFLLGESPRPEFTYDPWVVANLVLDGLPPELPAKRSRGLCWDNVLFDSPSLGYVVATHQDLHTQDHPTVLTWYYPCTQGSPAEERKRLLVRPWEDWKGQIVAELSRVHPGVDRLIRQLDVMLLGHAMIRPLPGFCTGAARAQAARAQGDLHFAHSDLGGISIFEEAQYHGVRAAQEALLALGHPHEDSLGV